MLKKRDRLTAKDIEKLSLGKSVFGTLLSLRFLAADRTRLSVAVSKKVAARAVDRNRMRRRLYAAVEGVLPLIALPSSILLMPKKECAAASLPALRAEVSSLLAKARLLS